MLLASVKTRHQKLQQLLVEGAPSASQSSFALVAYSLDISALETITAEGTIRDASGRVLQGVSVTDTLSECVVDADESSLTCDRVALNDDGVDEATFTVTLKEADGTPIPDVLVAHCVLASDGTATLTPLASATDADGVLQFTMTSTDTAYHTMTVTADGVLLTDEIELEVGNTPGSVASVTETSRDGASAAGGARVTFTVTGRVGVPDITFDGVDATEVTVEDDTHVSCVVPAHAAGVVAVVVGGQAFTNPRAAKTGGDFVYYPAPTTTFVDRDFEDGAVGTGLTKNSGDGTISVSTEQVYSGTYALKFSKPATTGGTNVRNTTNLDVGAETNGIYVRFYQYLPQASIDAVQGSGDQIKTFLFRRQAGNGQPGWLMTGIGSAFPDGAVSETHVSFIDNGILNINGTPNQGRSGIGGAAWHEYQYWSYWNGTAGQCRLWIDGILQFDVTHANLGSANTDYRLQLGIAYTQTPDAALTCYLDHITIANGFIDPVEV